LAEEQTGRRTEILRRRHEDDSSHAFSKQSVDQFPDGSIIEFRENQFVIRLGNSDTIICSQQHRSDINRQFREGKALE
jgi:hypothetical protein